MVKKLIGGIGILVLLAACQGGENSPNIELIQGMMDGPQVKTQEGGPKGELTMKLPPEGTVPRGFKPYPFDKFDNDAADTLKSPFSPEELKGMAQMAEQKFKVYCGICHGNEGKGDGTVAPKMVLPPPNLTEGRFVTYTDGRIYNVITNGFGLMGSYSNQLNEKERWAVVAHLRKLQAKGGN